MGPRVEGITLDRIDNNGNYEPGNCKWADRKTQRLNQRRSKFYTYNGKTLCLTDWIREITGCEDRDAYRLLTNATPRSMKGIK